MIAGILQTKVALKTKKPVVAAEPEVNYYDISEIIKISRGNEGFVQKMLKMFVDQVPKHLEEMKDKFQVNELVTVGEIAHRIKPTIDNMGIVSSKDTIREIEKIGKGGMNTGNLQQLIEKVAIDIGLAVEAIKKDFKLS